MKQISLLLCVFALSACSITEPITATSNPIGSKVGVSKGKCIMGICYNVDTGILTAAANGGITKISTVEYRTTSYFGIVKVYECIVSGE